MQGLTAVSAVALALVGLGCVSAQPNGELACTACSIAQEGGASCLLSKYGPVPEIKRAAGKQHCCVLFISPLCSAGHLWRYVRCWWEAGHKMWWTAWSPRGPAGWARLQRRAAHALQDLAARSCLCRPLGSAHEGGDSCILEQACTCCLPAPLSSCCHFLCADEQTACVELCC